MQDDFKKPDSTHDSPELQKPEEASHPDRAQQNDHEVITGNGGGWRSRRFNKLALLAVVLLVGIGGSIYLLVSHAETPAPTKPEDKPTYQAALPNPGFVPDAVLLKFKTGVPQAVQDK